jgi:hypothetical protein
MVQIVVYVQFAVVHSRRLGVVERFVDVGFRFLDGCVAGTGFLWIVVFDGRFGGVVGVVVVVTFGAEGGTLGGFGDLVLVAVCKERDKFSS